MLLSYTPYVSKCISIWYDLYACAPHVHTHLLCALASTPHTHTHTERWDWGFLFALLAHPHIHMLPSLLGRTDGTGRDGTDQHPSLHAPLSLSNLPLSSTSFHIFTLFFPFISKPLQVYILFMVLVALLTSIPIGYYTKDV